MKTTDWIILAWNLIILSCIVAFIFTGHQDAAFFFIFLFASRSKEGKKS